LQGYRATMGSNAGVLRRGTTKQTKYATLKRYGLIIARPISAPREKTR
jgi:hypothetical protein